MTSEEEYRSFIRLSYTLLVTSNREVDRDGTDAITSSLLAELLNRCGVSVEKVVPSVVFNSVCEALKKYHEPQPAKPSLEDRWVIFKNFTIGQGSDGRVVMEIGDLNDADVKAVLARDTGLQEHVGRIHMLLDYKNIFAEFEDHPNLACPGIADPFDEDVKARCNSIVAGMSEGRIWMGILL